MLHSATTIGALERWVGPSARRELDGQALVTEELVLWICGPPEAELLDAESIAWRALRRYTPRWRGFDAFIPGPLRRERPAELHLVGRTEAGALVHLGPAHLASYGRAGHEAYGDASFHLVNRLPHDLWLGLGGFAGLRLEANGVRTEVEATGVRPAVAALLAESVPLDLSVSRWTGDGLTVMFERERAFVVELTGPDYTGLIACDPGRSGEGRPVAFTHANGQVDEWPLEATVAHDQALDAISAWAEHGRAESLVWRRDPAVM